MWVLNFRPPTLKNLSRVLLLAARLFSVAKYSCCRCSVHPPVLLSFLRYGVYLLHYFDLVYTDNLCKIQFSLSIGSD